MDTDQILQKALQQVNSAETLEQLDAVRVQYLGKTGELTEQLKQLGKLPHEERKTVGALINQVKSSLQTAIQEKHEVLQQKAIQLQLASEAIDVTQASRSASVGSLHPVTLIKEKIADFFSAYGFEIADGPEIEDDEHNFTALNIPEHHPARAMQDTFYIDSSHVLRTHMSPVQIRTLEEKKPPLRMIAMGRVYRCDFDVTHTPMFHQLEGLVVEPGVQFSMLKGLIIDFLEYLFNEKLNIRFRPSFFPFTEPSAEVDIQCTQCQGKGCRACKQTGWLEVLGCGMVHPNVLNHCRVDTKLMRGFAFGVGIDRLAMLLYRITDLRMMFENDLRFLKQFV